jgi:hypothetical protein
MSAMKMYPKIGQIAIFGPHTTEIGVVSAIRRDGFYVRHTTGFPGKRRPSGFRTAGYCSKFFRFTDITGTGFDGVGVTIRAEQGR